MKKKIYTALITPFTNDLQIDYDALKRLINDLMQTENDGFIVCGTTAESATLWEEEKLKLLAFVIECVNHRKEIYFGCGSNHTQATIDLIKKVEYSGVDGLLIVTPYYNKPTQEGLYMHYHTIANATKLPIMLYEVKSRCGCELLPHTIKHLCEEHKNIVAYKYASTNMKKLEVIRNECNHLAIYCGDDAMIKACHERGCQGVVSVISHLYAHEIANYYRNEDDDSDFYFKRYSKLLMRESNPMCIKYVLSKKYGFSSKLRLPLVEPTSQTKSLLDAYFDKPY